MNSLKNVTQASSYNELAVRKPGSRFTLGVSNHLRTVPGISETLFHFKIKAKTCVHIARLEH